MTEELNFEGPYSQSLTMEDAHKMAGMAIGVGNILLGDAGIDVWKETPLLTALILYVASKEDCISAGKNNLRGVKEILTNKNLVEFGRRFEDLPEEHPAREEYNFFAAFEPMTQIGLMEKVEEILAAYFREADGETHILAEIARRQDARIEARKKEKQANENGRKGD